MKTRGVVVAGFVAAAVAAAGPAFGQSNANPPPGTVVIPPPPPADRPLITKPIPMPTLSVEGGMGILGYVDGTGRVGPAWNARATANFAKRFAVEGNYLGSVNSRSDNTGTLTFQSVDVDLRYNILLADEAPVQPYLSGGLGWAGFFGPGGTSASLVIPVAVGVERLLTERIKIGARFNLRPAFFDDLGHGNEKNAPGGSTWAILANVGGAF